VENRKVKIRLNMKQQVNVATLKPNETNPRYIKDSKFKKLVKSLKEFPEMLEKRPIVVDEDMVVLGGNMRLEAAKAAGIFEVWIDVAQGWTEQQKREFIIKDNASFGEWDWSLLGNDWNAQQLGEWGLDVWQPEEDVDYSILDDLGDLDDKVSDMESNVKTAIQIEFESEDYEPAKEIISELRKKDVYIGGLVYMHLKEVLDKL
jgi:hypothetical protein